MMRFHKSQIKIKIVSDLPMLMRNSGVETAQSVTYEYVQIKIVSKATF